MDLQNYHRRLKLWSYFEGKESPDRRPFIPTSNWTPPELNLPSHILNLIKSDLNYFENSFKILRMGSNLTPEENLALKEFTLNQKIVIKPADKGSVVVIMDLEQYLWERHRQLKDNRYYKNIK